MIRLTINGFAFEADTPNEIESAVAYFFSGISDKEMCNLMHVSDRTLRRLKASGAIKRVGRHITRSAFLSYLSANTGKKRTTH